MKAQSSNGSLSFRYSRRSLGDKVVIWELEGAPEPKSWGALMEDAERFMRELQQRGQRKLMLIDTSKVGTIPASERQVFSEWRLEHKELIRATVSHAAYVVTSPVMRGVMTAIFWFGAAAIETHIGASQKECLDWLERKSQRAAKT